MNNYHKLLAVIDALKNKNDLLLGADNTLDSKASSLLGFEIALGVGYATLVLDRIEGIKYIEGIIGLIFLLLSLLFLLSIAWPKKYIAPSVNIFQHKDYLNKSEKDLYLQLISDSQNAFSKNNEKAKRKSRIFKEALTFLLIASFLFVLSITAKFYV